MEIEFNVKDVKQQSMSHRDTLKQLVITNKVSGSKIKEKAKLPAVKNLISSLRHNEVVSVMYKGKESYMDSVRNAIDGLDKYKSSLANTLLMSEYIDEDQYQIIQNLKAEQRIREGFPEVEYAKNQKWITEQQMLKTLRKYYNVEFLERSAVMELQVLDNLFGMEACKYFHCFCSNGPKRELNYIVVDITNTSALDEIQRRFDNNVLLYTLSAYIDERLQQECERRGC